MSDSAIRDYAAAKRVAPATLARWLALPPGDREALLALATRLGLGENHFRDVLDDLSDIALRQGREIAAVLRDEGPRRALERPLGRSDAVKALKAALRRLRYPQLCAAERRAAELTRTLRLPTGVRVELPDDLEGEEVAVRLRASSAGELRAQARAVAAALQGDAVDELFAVLEGRW